MTVRWAEPRGEKILWPVPNDLEGNQLEISTVLIDDHEGPTLQLLPHSSLLLRHQITDINDITLCHTITSQAEFETSIAYLTVQHNRSSKTVLFSSRSPGPHCGSFTTVTPGLLCPMKTAGWWRGHALGGPAFRKLSLCFRDPGRTTPRAKGGSGSARGEKTENRLSYLFPISINPTLSKS